MIREKHELKVEGDSKEKGQFYEYKHKTKMESTRVVSKGSTKSMSCHLLSEGSNPALAAM